MNEITYEERLAGHKRALGNWLNFYTVSSGAGMTILKDQLVKALAELHTRADEERLERIALLDRIKELEKVRNPAKVFADLSFRIVALEQCCQKFDSKKEPACDWASMHEGLSDVVDRLVDRVKELENKVEVLMKDAGISRIRLDACRKLVDAAGNHIGAQNYEVGSLSDRLAKLEQHSGKEES